MKIPSPGFLWNAFVSVLRRFPGAMVCAFTGVSILFVLVETHTDEEPLVKGWIVCQLGLALMTGLVAWAESKGWPEVRRWILQAAGLAALGAYYVYLNTREESGFEYIHLPRYFVLLLSAHLLAAVGPYLNQHPVKDFWDYNRQLLGNFVIGGAFAAILFAGLSGAILAVNQLFDLSIKEQVYAKLFFLIAGIFHSVYFLFHFPAAYRFDYKEENYTLVFKNLCKYILIPIVALYFLILYAYSGKIIATWELPRGWVGSLVIGFSVVGIFTYLLNFYLPDSDSSPHVSFFKNWFWWILAPLTMLLFVAIGKRIGDYGVTEIRFLVAHLGVWLAMNCAYFLFSKKDNIKFIPISLALTALAYGFLPGMNAFSVSARSQSNRLAEILTRNDRFENGKIKQSQKEVPQDDAKNIADILQYLGSRRLLDESGMLPMPAQAFPQAEGSWNEAGYITEWLNVKPYGPAQTDRFYLSVTDAHMPVDISGYRTHLHLNLSDYVESREGLYLQLNKDQKNLELMNGKELLERFDLTGVLRSWAQKTAEKEYGYSLTPEERCLKLKGKKKELLIAVDNADIELKDGEWVLNNMFGSAFVK